MKEETKDRIFQLEISLAIIVVLVTVLSFFRPSITGFVPASVYTEKLDLTIDKNTAFTLFSNQDMQLTSFKISGQAVGNGKVHVYLSDADSQNLLVYTNMKSKEFGKNLITGMAVSPQPESEEKHSLIIQEIPAFNEDIAPLSEDGKIPQDEHFDSTCTETCSILMDLTGKQVYKLIVVIEGDAKLTIDRIAYSVNEADGEAE